MSWLKILFLIVVTAIILYALYMIYYDVVKYIPQEKNKLEKFEEPKLKIALFYATWCGYCTKYLKTGAFMDTYDKLKQQNQFDKVVFTQIDFDKNKELGSKYGISSFPTIVAISSDGDLVGEFKGDRSSQDDLTKFTIDSLNKL